MGEIDRFTFCHRVTVAGFDPQTRSICNVFSRDIDGPVTAADRVKCAQTDAV